MNCPACGAALQQRNRTRLIITGIGFFAAALVLVALLHLAVVILAGVVLIAIGVYFVSWAVKGQGLWCSACGRVPRQS
jgi:hypothetical protein